MSDVVGHLGQLAGLWQRLLDSGTAHVDGHTLYIRRPDVEVTGAERDALAWLWAGRSKG